jgi:hypothetical protein
MIRAIICKYCGLEFNWHSNLVRRFCSSECRSDYYALIYIAPRRRIRQFGNCIVCGQVFKAKANKNTCSLECRRARVKAKLRARRDSIRVRDKAYRAANREKINATRKLYLYKENKEKHQIRDKSYRKVNRDRIRAYREANRARDRARASAYFASHREQERARWRAYWDQLRIAPTIIRGIFGDDMEPRTARNTLKSLGLLP